MAAIPVVIDSDLGQDMDDVWNIGYLLSSKEVDVRLIVTSSRCTRGKAELLARYLTDVGRADVSIGVGIPTSPVFGKGGEHWCNGTGRETGCSEGFFVGPAAPYAQSFQLTNYSGQVHLDGVKAIADLASERTDVRLIAIGAFTNLAALQSRFPGILGSMHLIAMAGSINLGWRAAEPQTAEYNVKTDTAASRSVFRGASSWRSFTIAPLDTCGDLQLTGVDFQKFLGAAKSGAVAFSILRQYEVWYASGCAHHVYCSPAVYEYTPTLASTTLFDVQPAYMVAAPGAFSHFLVETMQLDVNGTGFLVKSSSGGLVNVTTAWLPGGRE
eukprot:CAMPEP_0197677750 /NCGR_PEP_ID=MMETSP1338-20131121/88909_1 /TAXON_ID=43686 ORGANISM="Pelagodinium beii, Strain RCC1491" /NCGR_SAMPLE_ID=MMETSP1338 /ASSEMBLY_ACC=CAM_ASM_000754 /LENGTH=326 /DNA_ID=CAMNT_0043258613 /DNA_START=85 /DNA_END=1062 /DNA_ORIENTATION=+